MSMKCDCGLTARNTSANRGHVVDAHLGTYTRVKHCACGKTFRTIEMRAADVNELRRKAYLWDRQQALATRQNPTQEAA